jgi:acyl dehydratase
MSVSGSTLTSVPAGSRLRARVKIVATEDSPNNGLRVTYGITVEMEGGQRPVCVAEVMAIHYR